MLSLTQGLGIERKQYVSGEKYPFNQAVYYPINLDTGSANQRIYATNSSLNPSGSDVTMEFWIWPEVGDQVRVIGGFGSLSTNGRFLIAFNAQQINLYLGNESLASINTYSVINSCGYGEWNHIVVTYENATRKPIIYINGWPHYQNITTNVVNIITDSDTFQIGSLFNLGSTYKFQGAIGRTRYWKRVLTGDEVRAAYKGQAVDSTNLMLDYKYDDGSGNTVTDHSGNGINATITNSALGRDIQWVPKIYYYNTDFETGMLRRNSVQGVPITHASDISFTQNTPFSVSFRHCAISTGQTVIINALDNRTISTASTGWVLYFDSSRRLSLDFYSQATNTSFRCRMSSVAYTANVGHVLSYTVTYDGSNTWPGVKFYANGIQIPTTVVASSLLSTTDISHSTSILIAGTNNTTNTVRGYISDICIFDQELSTENASALVNDGYGIDFTKPDSVDYYNNLGVQTICPNPVRYWPCNIANITSNDNFQNIVVKEKMVGDDLFITTSAPTNSNHGVWRMSLKYNSYAMNVNHSQTYASNYRYLYKKSTVTYFPDDVLTYGPSGGDQNGAQGLGTDFYCNNPYPSTNSAGVVLGKKLIGDFKIVFRIDTGASAKHVHMLVGDIHVDVGSIYTNSDWKITFGYSNSSTLVYEKGVNTYSDAIARLGGVQYMLIRRGDQGYFYVGEQLLYQTTLGTDDLYLNGLPWYAYKMSCLHVAAERIANNNIYIP